VIALMDMSRMANATEAKYARGGSRLSSLWSEGCRSRASAKDA
jgi:hypothetical protein